MTRQLSVAIFMLVIGCGGGRPALSGFRMPISGVGMSVLPDDVVSRALLARFEHVHCEADYCLDPFPLWAVTGIAVSDERIALAGPGALLSVFEDGAWTTYRAPVLEGDVEGDVERERTALHVVAFSPDGERLVVGGSEGRIYELVGDGLSILHTLAADAGDEPVTISALSLGLDDVVALGASGEIVRLHDGEERRHRVDLTLDRLLPMGRGMHPPLTEVLIVSGPFGGFVVEDAFGETPIERAFYTDDQIARMGEYSGCGVMEYDARAMAVYERTEELIGEGSRPEEAAARAERETPPRSENLPPDGITIPRSGAPAVAIESYLSATTEGRALLPIVQTSPTSRSGAVMVRRGRSVVVAVNEWPSGSSLWARLSARGFAARSDSLGAVGALDVSNDRLLAVGVSGTIASLAPGEAALFDQPANALLRAPTALRIVDDQHALVATERGLLFRIDLHSLAVSELPSPGGVIRAIDAGAGGAYAVGDDGLVVRVRDGTVSRMASGVSVDLTALHVLGERRLVVAGDASTIAILDEGEPRVLPRVSSDRIVELAVDGDEIFARTFDGATLHVEGEQVRARAGFGPQYATAECPVLRFAPTLEGTPFVERTTPLAVAVDTPDAVAPFGALLWDVSHDPFPTEHIRRPDFWFDEELHFAVFRWQGSSCCDSDGSPSELEQLLFLVHADDCDPEYTDCSPLTSLDLRHRLHSRANNTSISIVPGAGECPDITLLVERMSRGALAPVSREVLDCASGPAAQADALRARLGALQIDATWEPATDETAGGSGARSGVGFFLRAAGAGVEVVRSDDGNRHAGVVLRLPRTAMPGTADRIPLRYLASTVSEEPRGGLTAFEGGGFFWAGPTPSAMLDDESSDDGSSDDESSDDESSGD